MAGRPKGAKTVNRTPGVKPGPRPKNAPPPPPKPPKPPKPRPAPMVREKHKKTRTEAEEKRCQELSKRQKERGAAGLLPHRPKGCRNWRTVFKELCAEEIKKGSESVGNAQELVAKRVVAEALKGERWACELLMNRMDGAPTQVVETSGPEGGPIQIDVASVDAEIDALVAKYLPKPEMPQQEL